MLARTRCSVVALLLLTAAPLQAREPRTHDGFLLRLSGGFGRAETSINDAGTEAKASGGSVDLNIAIGAMISEKTSLHATLWGWSVPSPEATLGTMSGTASDVALSMSAVGVGITYWFLPVNVYFSPSVGYGTLSLQRGSVTVSSDSGFALDGTLGKEWWVSDGWGLGIAAGFSWHSIADGGIDANWNGPGFGIRFSATMN